MVRVDFAFQEELATANSRLRNRWVGNNYSTGESQQEEERSVLTASKLSITTYTVDSFDKFSASALAAITTARSVGGAILPLLGPIVYAKLGQGLGNSAFAGVILLSCSLPVLLYMFGRRWRSLFSANDLA